MAAGGRRPFALDDVPPCLVQLLRGQIVSACRAGGYEGKPLRRVLFDFAPFRRTGWFPERPTTLGSGGHQSGEMSPEGSGIRGWSET